MASPSRHDIERVARRHLGFEHLRPGQLEAVSSVLQGRDTLVVQPTGSGKSAIYQIAGLLIEGATVVVSPLIALQKDQVDSIEDGNPANAVAINSAQRTSQTREHFEQVDRGEIEYIFLAPEQLRKPDTVERLKEAGISLFVIDEAHCISEWGHDFRPDYLRLGDTIELLGHPRVLALTATASPRVQEEIVERLRMRRANVLVQDLDRPNISLRVDHFKTESEKQESLVHRVHWADKPGIVYVGTRKAAQAIVADLVKQGIQAVYYHAGLKAEERERIQNRFMSGDAEVIVATNAFGMGVDKPDIRFIYHFHAPDSLDAYYQEIGRAGRDGEKSEAVLFYRPQDIGAQSYKTGEGKIDPEDLEELAQHLAGRDGPVQPAEVSGEVGLSARKLTSAVQRLEDVGAAEMLPTGEVRILEEADLGEAARAAAEQQELRREGKRDRLGQMRRYAEMSACRRELLLGYLGQEYRGPCNACDNCERAAGKTTVDPRIGRRREVT